MGRVRCAASPAPGAAGAQSGQPWALPKENRQIRSISSVPLCSSGLTGVVVLYFAGSDQVAQDSTLGWGRAASWDSLSRRLPGFSGSETIPVLTGAPGCGEPRTPAPPVLPGFAALPIDIPFLLSFVSSGFPSFLMAL